MRQDPGIVTVRPFDLEQDLEAAADFGDRARADDPSVEPFAQRLALIASGPRARLDLWQVAQGEDGKLHGLVFAALREARAAEAPPQGHVPPGAHLSQPPRPPLAAGGGLGALVGGGRGAPSKAIREREGAVPGFVAPRGTRHPMAPPPLSAAPSPSPSPSPSPAPRTPAPAPPPRATVELYGAVSPALRRQGLGRALFDPALAWAQASPEPVTLRARVRDDPQARAGAAFLAALGFTQTAAQLSLAWQASRSSAVDLPGVAVEPLDRKDLRAVEAFARLTNDAWAGAPDSFATRSDELAQLLSELGRVILLARAAGRPVGYLSGVFLGRTLGIEEVAVLPEVRRAGIGRALVSAALAREAPKAAILSVSEANRPARALYRSLGFTQTARKLVLELAGGPPEAP